MNIYLNLYIIIVFFLYISSHIYFLFSLQCFKKKYIYIYICFVWLFFFFFKSSSIFFISFREREKKKNIDKLKKNMYLYIYIYILIKTNIKKIVILIHFKLYHYFLNFLFKFLIMASWYNFFSLSFSLYSFSFSSFLSL